MTTAVSDARAPVAWASARLRFIDPSEFAARAIVGSLFLMLALRLAQDFLATRRVTGLVLLSGELLVVVLTIVRRPALCVDRRWCARLITAVSLAGPPLLRPSAHGGLVPDLFTAGCSAAGVALALAGKLSLGRSFGLIPANRGIVTRGVYRLIRHPIYAGYMLTHVGFCVAHTTWWNLAVFGIGDAMLLARAYLEERTLVADPAYQTYVRQVRWRVVPGIF